MTEKTGTMRQAKVPGDLIEVGQSLPFDIFAEHGFLLMKKGHYVLTDEQKKKLERIGVTQFVTEEKIEEGGYGDATQESKHLLPGPFDEMSHLYQRTRALLRQAMHVKDFPGAVLSVAQSILLLAQTQPDAVVASILLAPFREYAPAHSVHTAAMLALLTRRMSLPPRHRETLLCAALTMNIAQVELQNELFGQQAALTRTQQEEIKSHPLLGSAILREAGVEDELWHTLVQTHHESWTGGGYPFSLGREQILPPAHILHLADIVCAKLTPRRYRSALLPATALGQIFQRKDAEFDEAFTTLLIKELGIYPPGSFVKLASNEIGVVTYRGNKPSTPQVAALRKVDGPAYAEPLIRESRNPAYKVLEPCSSLLSGVRPGYLGRLWRL
ncbi:HD-GYP domain-containing protein [Paludibacterium purpuratum]|uniref:HD-GYP domain-containing protein (C-di-GMP phosphodiesterase class II) n=1 Tax=Paludibacterium purpuratum TaxID=1144873 RepID=A0A4V3DV69_9NEIS|nr:HD domain-containing phosphohydrolase [Paludibacterium purpuratum]TDR79869.1 HD-GYP domain-containing protein (c-di-GMP phosphodiesterase class II) [Paludibacterium purpuratum]